MKKTLAIALFMLFIPLYAIGIDYESVINSEASMNRDVMPDTVSIRFYVEDSGTNIDDIKAKNDKIVNLAIENIKKILGKDDTVKTISYRMNSVYSYKNQTRIFQKYEISNGFEVKTKDLSKISKIIKTATDSGVKRVEQLNFSLSDSESICNEMMSETAKMAKRRAESIASATGSSLFKIKNINTYCSLSSSQGQPRLYSNKSMGVATMDSAEVVDSIEPGLINVRTNANVSYYLK